MTFYVLNEEDLEVNIDGRYVEMKVLEGISLMLLKKHAIKLLKDLNYLEQGGHLNETT